MNSFNRTPKTRDASLVVATQSYPLTPTQLGMIYESVLVDRPWINLEQVVSHMPDEPVEVAAMRDAWACIAARHDILRTVFDWKGRDGAVQTVMQEVVLSFETADWSELSATEQEAALRDWLAQDRTRGVDLTRTPNWRVTWFRLGPRSSVLVWTFHHALLDGRSFTTLLREVLDSYTAKVSDGPTTPANLLPNFADHCRAVSRFDLSEAERYFRHQLDGFDGPNKVDLGNAGKTVDSRFPDGGESNRKLFLDRRLPVALGELLSERAKSSETSVATLVMAAWGLILARCSGRGDAVFGTTRSGRYLVQGAKQMVGCLISTAPVRLISAPDLTIDTMLRELREGQIAARPHEHTPLGDIAKWAGLPGGSTLFDSAVVFERNTVDHGLWSLGGIWATRSFEVIEEGALPLTLAVYQDPTILVRLEFDPECFSKAVAKRLIGYTLATLEALATLPGDTPLSLLDMLQDEERSALLSLGTPPAQFAAEEGDSILDRLDDTAARHGGKTALCQVGLDQSMSYSDLSARSDNLARLLQASSVGSGDIVALLLPRSPDFVVAALAVLKSGAAFLPIDPTYPRKAIDHILSDSGACLMVAPDEKAVANESTPILDLKDVDLEKAPTAALKLLKRPAADALAYVIYTSGSTGAPKGVMIPHSALSAHMSAVTRAFALRADDRVLQFASLSFDVSIEELLPTLASGATLVLRSVEMATAPAAFLEETARLELSVLNLPTAFWHALVDHMHSTGARLASSVRLVIVGGETVTPGALSKFRQMNPEVRILNGYGPTEATITATLYDPAETDSLTPDDSVPIGRPLPHTKAYVVAPDGSLAPMGAQGELYLGGVAVAQGYLDRPELTAQKFVTDPFAKVSNDTDRIFRTGDLVRWSPAGTLSFTGRADRQIKINGFRIEPRQIELALEALPKVSLALVSADRSEACGGRLLAWVTAADSRHPPDPSAIREQLQSRMPSHMIPTTMAVERFPQTPGGKIDMAALPRPSDGILVDEMPVEHDETVRGIMGIFAGLLDAPKTGPDSSFFDLGGHSLLAVRLIGTIEAEYGHRLSIAALHTRPTPRGIAAALNASVASCAAPRFIVPIQPQGSRPPIYGVHVLGTNEAFYRPLAKSLGPDQPLYGLSVGAQSDAMPTGVKSIATTYCEDIQRFQPTGPVCLAAVSLGSFIAFDLAQQLRKAGREVLLLALFDSEGPGGRTMIGTSDRLKAHLRILIGNGPTYLATLMRNRCENLRNYWAKARLRLSRKLARQSSAVQNVEMIVAANALAIEAYDPSPYFGRLTVFRASENLFDAPEALADGLGWAPVAHGGLDLIEVSGGHLTMLETPCVDGLALHLRQIIDAAGDSGQKSS